MNRFISLLLLLSLVAGTTLICCWIGIQLFAPPKHRDIADSHLWIHDQLDITPEQDRELHETEDRFAKSRESVSSIIAQENRQLADVLLTDHKNQERINQSLTNLANAHAQLQRATVEHILEMEPILSSNQFLRLRELTADALKNMPADSPLPKRP